MWYRTTNKNHGFVGQIVNKESCTRCYTTMLEALTNQRNMIEAKARRRTCADQYRQLLLDIQEVCD
jgi:hypothetical protein